MNASGRVQAILNNFHLACWPSPDVDDAAWSVWLDSFIAPRLCPKCGKALVKRNSRRGEFYGCNGYPGCKYTEDA